MNGSPNNTRVIALDVRPQRLGHVILEGPSQLIDYGVARFKKSNLQVDRVVRLMGFFHPSVVVFRRIEKGSWRDRPSLRTMMHSIRRQVRFGKIPIVHIHSAAVKRLVRGGAKPTRSPTFCPDDCNRLVNGLKSNGPIFQSCSPAIEKLPEKTRLFVRNRPRPIRPYSWLGSEEAREVALTLASVRLSNCTYGFPVCSFRKDA